MDLRILFPWENLGASHTNRADTWIRRGPLRYLFNLGSKFQRLRRIANASVLRRFSAIFLNSARHGGNFRSYPTWPIQRFARFACGGVSIGICPSQWDTKPFGLPRSPPHCQKTLIAFAVGGRGEITSCSRDPPLSTGNH